MMKIQSRPLT